MVVIDHFSSWVTVYFLADKTAASIWSKMKKYMMSEGVPRIIHSDNGGEFQTCVMLFLLPLTHPLFAMASLRSSLPDLCLILSKSCLVDPGFSISDQKYTYGYEVSRGAPRHPQSQGKVERWNRTVGSLLGSRHAELGSPAYFEWWKYALDITHNYNFATLEGSNASPYQVRIPPTCHPLLSPPLLASFPSPLLSLLLTSWS